MLFFLSENKLTCCILVLCDSRYDFFIVSQSVKDGTVTPTHYNVIHDTVHFTPDGIQCLTYRLCHMYYNLSVSTFFDMDFPIDL